MDGQSGSNQHAHAAEVARAREALATEMSFTAITTALTLDISFRNNIASLQAILSTPQERAEVPEDDPAVRHKRCVGCTMCICGCKEDDELHRNIFKTRARGILQLGLEFGSAASYPRCVVCSLLLAALRKVGVAVTQEYICLINNFGRIQEIRVSNHPSRLYSAMTPCNLEIYTPDGNNRSNFPTAQHIALDPLASPSLKVIQERLGDCATNHNHCYLNDNTELPTRVLDVYDANKPTLVETKDIRGRYMTLSHCWGEPADKPLMATKDTLEALTHGIERKDFPKTFLDAIDVTHALGVRYLWIDSLCILQDSDDDWAAEASRMAQIYQNSFLTVAATSGKNSRAGLWNTRTAAEAIEIIGGSGAALAGGGGEGEKEAAAAMFVRPKICHDIWTEIGGASLYNISVFKDRYPLLYRRWVLQERLLSPRVLHFTFDEWVLECNSMTSCECGLLNGLKGIARKRDRSIDNQSGAYKASMARLLQPSGTGPNFDIWATIVEDYTAGGLTFANDCLPAMSGIARQFAGLDTGRYLAGIWENNMPGALVWGVGADRRSTRPSPPLAPSWSWTSISGRVSTQSLLKNQECVARFIGGSCVPQTADSFGKVLSGGSITISGPAVEAMYEDDSPPPSGDNADTTRTESRTRMRKDVVMKLGQQCRLILETASMVNWDSDEDKMLAKGSVPLFCVWVTNQMDLVDEYRARSLVLYPSKLSPGSFVRLGTMSGFDEWYKGLEHTEVTLI
ncbi:HET-domain-containing protein [Cadophora sp. DSE1049]|nr:HET-domain-containing protein [Cadophora sp. DSE1049]